jgi:hypothetical protein
MIKCGCCDVISCYVSTAWWNKIVSIVELLSVLEVIHLTCFQATNLPSEIKVIGNTPGGPSHK